MAESDRPAVHVHLLHVQTELLHAVHVLRRERLVDLLAASVVSPATTQRPAAAPCTHLVQIHLVLREPRQLERHRGREVKTTGDGFLALFDGPGRAVACAQSLVEQVRPLGIELRAGLHAGEVEVMGEDVGGIAVHIGARVAAAAGPSEVLVSSTVKDLTVGSALTWDDRGERTLKGVPGEWKLWAVA